MLLLSGEIAVATPRQPSSPLRFAILLAAGWAACTATADEPRGGFPRPTLKLPAWIESWNKPRTTPETTADLDGGSGRGTGWLELLPVAGPAAGGAATKPPSAGEGTSLRRWLADRMAALPKPTALVPDAAPTPAAESEADATKPEPQPEPAAAAPDVPVASAPVAAMPDEMPTLSIDPASFRGAHPGKTTRAELEANWGPGEVFDREDGTQALWWKIEPFERVEVTVADDTVASIRIKLAEPVAIGDLARQLEISDLRTVAILDEQGVSIGQVYPERGVILSVKPGTQAANAIMIEPLDPESFVLRAEGEFDTCSANAVADLLYAIQIDPDHVRAHRMLLAMTSEQGKWTRALQLAEKSATLDPADTWVKVKHGGVLLSLDRPEEARVALEAVLARENNPPLVTAQVHRLLGRAALAGKSPSHQTAVEHFAEAIRRAAPLVARKSTGVPAAAREVLLDAHLGTAEAIAEGTWQQKGRVIPKWITRSEAIVDEFKGTPLEKMVLELQLCRGALAVSAASTEAVEPMPWVKRLLELRDRMGAKVADPWRRRQIDWQVGQALADALAAAQKRGDATDALDNATLTAAYLERGAEHRELTANERKEYGELLFEIGIMHSLQRGDHATAVTWFDQAIPLWENNDAVGRVDDLGRLGESYVSMAISYWQVSRRPDALALSRRGVDLMVAAVNARQLEERALAVAYGNLATMYAEEGDDVRSRTYAEMASRAEATGTTLR
jgi:tetratricopeptide (TPR) repeat protein